MYYRIWIPKSLSERVINEFHDVPLAGHVGRRKTYNKLEDRVFWLGMAKNVGHYIRKCEKCARAKPMLYPPVPSTSYIPDSPWEICSLDLAGPYSKGAKQSTVILIVLDLCTKWVDIFPIKKASISKIVEHLNTVFCRFGFPRVLLSDNGSQFASNCYVDWCKMKGISTFLQSPYHACSNPIERYIGSIKGLVRALMSQMKDWNKNLEEVAFALRTSVNESTKFTPRYLNFMREIRTPFDNLVKFKSYKSTDIKEMHERMILVHDIVRENMLASQDKNLKYKNEGTRERQFEVGDMVWMRTHILSDKAKAKSRFGAS